MINRLARILWVVLGLLTLTATAWAVSPVIINEIHYAPPVNTEQVEFIELHNPGTNSVALAGWRFSSGVGYTFPAGTTIAAKGYLVVAANPTAFKAKFGSNALGPWTGKLSNHGDHLELRDGAGSVQQAVDYQLGFPWPTVGDLPGFSIELINPTLDNSLGGSWRASAGLEAGRPTTNILINAQLPWRFLKGTVEASSPTTAWRQPGFNDSAWTVGVTPIGYGENFLSTVLSDMQGGYSSVSMRREFVVTNLTQIQALSLEAQYDDGFRIWINGNQVVDANVPAGDLAYNATAITALENASFVVFNLDAAIPFLHAGTNTIAVHGFNSSISASSDFFFDMRLLGKAGGGKAGPSPGVQNSVFANGVPPQIRQVDHSPNSPRTGEAVRITAKVTDPDGVASVRLEYQIVDPGAYIELNDPAYLTNWTSVVMKDDGVGADLTAQDGVYSVELPATLQKHRRLMRYRVIANDSTGLGVRVPYSDDPAPNFAYFVYDGIPAWTGAVRPGSTAPVTFDTNVMGHLPAYHLIAKSNAVANATWFSRYDGSIYQWSGTMVYDGKVYDHIRYRTRGGVWRYAMVKNMWKFDLNRGHDFEARDNWGQKYKTKWTKINLGSCIQQGDFNHRGEQGMFESLSFRLFNKAGVDSPNTAFIQFRVIDDALESDPKTQYEGDFWGLYLALEQEDGRFLNEHDLPDGNLYKMEGGTGELNNLGAAGPADKSDLNSFLNTYRGTTPSESWWRTNFNLGGYYSYQAIVQGLHHYDICYQKNYFYFRDPNDGLWSVHTWDTDLTWADNMFDANCGGADEFKNRVLNRAPFTQEYRNRVREIRDLLFNSDQGWKMIDEHARLLRGTGTGPNILDADRSMWDYNPKMANSAYSSSSGKAGQGRYYQWPNEPTVSKDFNGCVQLMKNYVNSRGANILDASALDSAIPSRPLVTYTGPANYAFNRLAFNCSDYRGTAAFSKMRWRIAEVSYPGVPGFDPTQPQAYEIDAVWVSEPSSNFVASIQIPPGVVKVGRTYRVRAQFTDATGRTSNWSVANEFTANDATKSDLLVANLRLTELMYNPVVGSEFEFIELWNASGTQSLDLEGAHFSSGIDYTFPAGAVLQPKQYLLVVKAAPTNDFAGFRGQYQLPAGIAIVGPYSGSMSDSGEQLTLKASGAGQIIFDLTYGDSRNWPQSADGRGHSLVVLDPNAGNQTTGGLDYAGNWRASATMGGSPGVVDASPAKGPVLNEIVAHTDFLNEADSNDWIELYNPLETEFVFPAGWFLSDDGGSLKKYGIPAGTRIAAHGFLVLDEVHNFHTTTNGFGLNKGGDEVFLSYLPASGAGTIADSVAFKGQENGASWGRYPDGAPNWIPLAPRTPGAANSQRMPAPLITEVMFNPLFASTSFTNSTPFQFVEIWNPLNAAVALFNTNGVYRLDGGLSFYFPAGTILQPKQSLLVANLDANNPAQLAEFRRVYSLGTNVTVLGPFAGKLGGRGDRVALERPQAPDLPGSGISWVVMDEVNYGNQAPWSTSLEAAAHSLQRDPGSVVSDSPEVWRRLQATPGVVGVPGEIQLAPEIANGALTVKVHGPAHDFVVLEGSTDLRAWSPVSTNEFRQGTTVFQPATSGGNAVFFRVRVK